MKNFGVDFDTVLYDISYVNVIMYNRTLPDYDYDSKDSGGKKGRKNSGKNLLELDNAEWENYQH